VKRLLLAGALAASFVLGSTAQAAPPVPGGKCDNPVDVVCRRYVCGPDDLDCGMIPPCFVWVSGDCLL
jgi:hypothetical protein